MGTRSESFIDWWWQKTRRDALVDHNRMMFTDQRWIDFVPGFFDHCILKDPTYNVAYWNLHARDLTWSDRYRVDGKPLTFFHFSGFDIRKPYLLSKHQGDRPRILLSERPAVARICREYLAEPRGARHRRGIVDGRTDGAPCRLESASIARCAGSIATGSTRHESGKGPEPPNPFDAAEPKRVPRLVERAGRPAV